MGRQGNTLEEWEVEIIKAMLAKAFVPQDILAYFSRPKRSINSARISEIRHGRKHKSIKSATETELDRFLKTWPSIDPATGLHHRGSELIIKSREAMIAAVHSFNNTGLCFRAELFIVTSIIAWTYLLLAYYKRKDIDYRHKKDNVVMKTKSGEEKYWELGSCLKCSECPLEGGVRHNLKLLIEIRHEIEHRSTNRIDEALAPNFQACCINFNNAIKKLFGEELSLEKPLPIALQFVTFDDAQRDSLIGTDLPPHIAAVMKKFYNKLTKKELSDPEFRYCVVLAPNVSDKVLTTDSAIELINSGTSKGEDDKVVFVKEEVPKVYLPAGIVAKVKEAGYPNFIMHDHTLLVKQLHARDSAKGFGIMLVKTWHWYENWYEKIIKKLEGGWERPRKKEILV